MDIPSSDLIEMKRGKNSKRTGLIVIKIMLNFQFWSNRLSLLNIVHCIRQYEKQHYYIFG